MNKVLSFIIALIACAVAGPANAAGIFVSPTGNDIGPGTLAKPFATLARAQIAARKARAQGAVTIYLRGGR